MLEAWAARFQNQTDKVDYMAYLEFKIVGNACINHQKKTLLTPFLINLLLI